MGNHWGGPVTELIIGHHRFVEVKAASGTIHGLHCVRCGLDLWRKCVRCGVTIVPLNDDDKRAARRAYCTPQCRRAGALKRAKEKRARRKAKKEARTK